MRLQRKLALENTARGAAIQPHERLLRVFKLHNNEEASSGGLKEKTFRVTTRRYADEQPRDTAITSFISFSFEAALHLPCFANRRAGDYACVLVIPARYAVKPARRAVMTVRLPFIRRSSSGYDGHAAS